jgi:phosphoribosylformimino-5-aminoimidazole carboxamide ribotide isomerase
LKIAFDSGANQITGGSIAIKNRALFENGFKNTVLIKLYLVRTPTMKKWPYQVVEESDEDLTFIQGYQAKGIKHVICTDIAKDGMLEGPSFDLYAKILAEAKE